MGRIVEGKTGPGSLYALYVPRDWNGSAVFYAHGIRPPMEPISLRDQDDFFTVRDQLGALGYAFAYSSFSENGLSIKDGAQRTHQLRGLLRSEIKSQPTRSYLVGYSLGALVSLDLAERFPRQYDGVLTMCGMIGGTPLELDYIGHVRALFDFFYPGILPGTVVDVPAGASLTPALQGQIIAAISSNPIGLFAIASAVQTPLAFAPIGSLADPTSPAFQSLVGSLFYALGYQLIGTPDVVDRTRGQSPFDNSTTTYVVGTLRSPNPAYDAAIAGAVAAANSGVVRSTSPVSAQNYLEKYYVPSGALRIPMVSVHNLWDPLVPYFHETAFAQIAGAAGASNMLLQRAVPNYGHCNFPASLVISSFQTLVDWVETGVKPAG
ncbi:alpha/beta hydrolase [soil metagenome]